MNPLTNTRNITKLNEKEVHLGISEKASWHNEYKDSAWIFVGGINFELTEGDIICVFSQYGELVNINFIRDKKTGKPKGYCFICYEDQRSTILAVDNLNGIKLCNRIIRVDHVASYRVPKEDADLDEETQRVREEGCAPKSNISLSKIKRENDESKHKPFASSGGSHKVSERNHRDIEAVSGVSKRDSETRVRVKKEVVDPDYVKYEIRNTEDKRKKDSVRDWRAEDEHSDNRRRDRRAEDEHSDNRRRDRQAEDEHSDNRRRDRRAEDEHSDNRRRDRQAEDEHSDNRRRDRQAENVERSNRHRDRGGANEHSERYRDRRTEDQHSDKHRDRRADDEYSDRHRNRHARSKDPNSSKHGAGSRSSGRRSSDSDSSSDGRSRSRHSKPSKHRR